MRTDSRPVGNSSSGGQRYGRCLRLVLLCPHQEVLVLDRSVDGQPEPFVLAGGCFGVAQQPDQQLRHSQLDLVVHDGLPLLGVGGEVEQQRAVVVRVSREPSREPRRERCEICRPPLHHFRQHARSTTMGPTTYHNLSLQSLRDARCCRLM
ncbi:hypothetical protein OU415_09615 [Saccharopolyspora sp. WRP15-2]|uniref:Uncharacterized protein n=1 Tax=Saccharopolyspora oryzae TaxID=2997343 RepID=A0ABT4UVF4_9PSEU|nr:hypothetical protein [Saccharopolyspora oryzae]MDA3625693.1 hypothetical protein [Saccharopolyspora oryzae]